MKFNDDTLMLFDLDTCLDYNTYDTIGGNYSDQFVDFACDDLEQFSNFSNNLNAIKTCSLIDEIDLFANGQPTNETDFGNEFCDFTDSLFNSNSSSFNSSINSSSFNSSINSSSFNSSSFNSSNNSSSLNSSSFNSPSFNSPSLNSSSFNTSSLVNSTNSPNGTSSNVQTNSQDKRDVKKKLLDLTQRKLTHTLCFDNKLRNQVLLKSALKNVNSIDEDNLLGTKTKLESVEELSKDKSIKDKLSKDNLSKDKSSKDKFNDQNDHNSTKITSQRKRNFKNNLSTLSNDKELLDEKTKIKKQKLSHLDETEDYFIDENNFNYNDELTLNNLANCFIKLKTQHSHD